MALFLSMPLTFRVGDTEDCRINTGPAKVTWRDTTHLVIHHSDADDDVRVILDMSISNDLLNFICGSAAHEPQTPLHISRPRVA